MSKELPTGKHKITDGMIFEQPDGTWLIVFKLHGHERWHTFVGATKDAKEPDDE